MNITTKEYEDALYRDTRTAMEADTDSGHPHHTQNLLLRRLVVQAFRIAETLDRIEHKLV